MKNIKKEVIKKSILMITVIAMGLANISIPAFAMDVSVAVSPSKIYDKQINLGESSDFTFYATNKSKNVPDNKLQLTLNIEGTIESQYGDKIENNGILTFNKSQFILGIDDVDSVVATVKIPKDFIQGNYKMYIDFIQQPVEGFSLGAQTNVIKVPIYVFAGTENEYANLKVDFDVLNSYISNGITPTTIIKESVNSCLKLINPLNTINTFKDIKDKPSYIFKKGNTEVVDINNDIYTEFSKVSTTKKDLSDTKYIYYEKSWLNKKIKSSKIESSFITITLEDDNIVAIKGTNNSLQYIQEQITNIATKNKNIDLQYLFDNLKVPKNVNYEKSNPILISEVKSNSDIPITLNGKEITTKDNSEEITNKEIFSPTIMPGETISVQNTISEKELNTGNYLVDGTFNIRDIKKDINHSFDVKNCRNTILIIMGIFIIIYYAVIFIIIRIIVKLIIKKIKNRKSIESENNEDTKKTKKGKH